MIVSRSPGSPGSPDLTLTSQTSDQTGDLLEQLRMRGRGRGRRARDVSYEEEAVGDKQLTGDQVRVGGA